MPETKTSTHHSER